MADSVITGVFSAYRARKGDWCVGELTDKTIITGEFAEQLLPGIEYELFGFTKDNGQYGKQFKVKSFRQKSVATHHGVVSYLQRHVNSGIGPVTAQALWDSFGADAVKVLRTDPERAAREVKRLRLPVAQAASNELQLVAKFEDVSIQLTDTFAGRGFPHRLVQDCIRLWKVHAADVVRKDPFRMLVSDMIGCGYARCMRLYQDLGLPMNRVKIQVIALWSALREANDGDTWISKEACISKLAQCIGAGVVLKPEKAIRIGVRARWFSIKKDKDGKTWIAESEKAYDEWRLAEKLKKMRTNGGGAWLDCDKLEGVTPHQRAAAAIVTSESVGILGGSAGTGKTFTLAQIIKLASKQFGQSKIAGCAPCGKAAIRITQGLLACNADIEHATTIHRLLRPQRNGHDKSGWGFFFNEENLLPHDFIYCDESSMKDTSLAADLICAMRDDAKLILCGDFRQIMPVGHGKPLLDMISAGFPYGELTEIHRNSGDIVRVCADINAGRKYVPSTGSNWKNGENVFHFPRNSTADQLRCLRGIYENAPEEFDRIDGIQVLVITNESSPVSKKPVNDMLQEMLNPKGNKVGPYGLRIGDKVMCVENGEATDVRCVACGDLADGSVVEFHGGFTCLRCGTSIRSTELDTDYCANGELGKIVDSGGDGLHVRFEFPRRVLRFTGEQMKRIELAYAGSVHKFQGSQIPFAILLADDSTGAAMVASRQLLMTAISRAEKLAATIGKVSTLDAWIAKDSVVSRKTFLAEMLRA